MTPAEHILQWALNDSELARRVTGLAALKPHDTFATSTAAEASLIARRTYMRMQPDRTQYDALDILQAAVLMVEHSRREEQEREALKDA